MSWTDDFASFFGFGGDSPSSNTLPDFSLDYEPPIYDLGVNDQIGLSSPELSSVGPGSDFSFGNDFDLDLPTSFDSLNLPSVDPSPSSDKAPFYTNPNLLGAAITAGAGLFQGMSALDVQKQNLKAQKEAQKMNNLLELAKLKNQILMRGSSGSGGRASGSGGSNQAEATDRQHSSNKISQLSNLGANLANIYRG